MKPKVLAYMRVDDRVIDNLQKNYDVTYFRNHEYLDELKFANTIFSILLAAARKVAELDHYVKSGQWNVSLQSHQYGLDVHHKTLGISGWAILEVPSRAEHI